MPTNSAQRCGAAISISRLRPHCFDASMTARRSRSRACSTGWATPRAVASGIKRLTPNSTAFSTSHFCRSPLGRATPSTSGQRQLAIDLVAGEDGQLDFRPPEPLDAGGELAAAAVEQRDLGRRLQPHDVEQMMGFRPAEHGPAAADGRFDEIALGHGR